jgi:tetratricopeptide (TPR) repeat protein
LISLAKLCTRFWSLTLPVCIAVTCALPSSAQSLPVDKQQEVDALTKQIGANGNDYSLYAKRGLIYLRAKSFQNADENFQRGLIINSKWQEGLLLHANCLAGMGRYREAISAVDKAEMLGPLTAQKLQWRGDLFMKLKEFKPAVINFSKAIELNPTDYLNWVGRAMANRELVGPSKIVESDLIKSVELNPSFELGRKMLANVQKEMAASH